MRRDATAAVPDAGPSDSQLRRRYFLGGLAAGLAAMSAAGLAAVFAIATPAQVAARSAVPPPSLITAVARWQVLRTAIVVPGTVRAARNTLVTAQGPYGTLVVTRMPVRAGDRVQTGHIAAEIDGRPILVLEGRLPPYRDLHVGDSGPDVTQLQEALEHLGYPDFDPPGFFGPSTSLALLLLYRSLGYQAPLYGGPAGRLPRQVRPPRSAAIPSAYLPISEVAFIPARSALVVAVYAGTGAAVAPGQPVVRLATGNPLVSGVLSDYQARLARPGMAALIASARPSLAVRGTVTRVGPVPPPAAFGAGALTGYPIQVSPGRPLPQRAIGARVRLTLFAPVTSGPVLTVPVAAVFAVSGRSRGTGPPADRAYVIRVTPGGRRHRILVSTGPSADGLVAVQPATAGALRRGERVLIGVGR